MIKDPSQSILYSNSLTSLHRNSLDKYSLSDLLKLREDVKGQKKDIIKQHGKQNYSMVLGKIQSYIWYRRTHRKSGLIIPYDKDITED